MEYMPRFTLHQPESIEAAVALAAREEGARYLGGGTDLVVNVRRGIEDPRALIDLTHIPALRHIGQDGGDFAIGAGVTLSTLGRNELVVSQFPAIAEAALAVAGPTHQAYGTLGGNLCLDTRCIFYNQSEWWRASNDYCLKYRGDICHVAPGGKRCFAAFSGDVAPALLVHGAEVEVIGPKATRRMPLADLYRNDGMDHLKLEPGEMLARVFLPQPQGSTHSAYAKIRVRGSIDFPLAGAAVLLRFDGTNVADLRVGLTAVNPLPFLVTGLEAFVGKPLDDDALEKLRETVRKQARPMRTTTIKPWYRRRAVGALAAKLARRLAET